MFSKFTKNNWVCLGGRSNKITLRVWLRLNHNESCCRMLTESGRHLQEVVDVLLARIENANSELENARREQQDILTQLSDKNTRVNELER